MYFKSRENCLELLKRRCYVAFRSIGRSLNFALGVSTPNGVNEGWVVCFFKCLKNIGRKDRLTWRNLSVIRKVPDIKRWPYRKSWKGDWNSPEDLLLGLNVMVSIVFRDIFWYPIITFILSRWCDYNLWCFHNFSEVYT